MKRALILVYLALLASCAQRRPSGEEPSGDGERAEARAADQRAEALDQQFLALTASSAPPDCQRVCGLVGQICDLSERICALAGRHRDDVELEGRCTTAEQRCRRAQERSASRCSCQPPR